MTNLRVVAHLGSGGGGGTESNNEVPTPTKTLFYLEVLEFYMCWMPDGAFQTSGGMAVLGQRV